MRLVHKIGLVWALRFEGDVITTIAADTCNGFISTDPQQQIVSSNKGLDQCQGLAFARPEPEQRQSADLVVAIITAPSNGGRRAALRDTWLAESAELQDVVFRFYVGLRGEQQIETQLAAESKKHSDMVLMQFEEKYSKLSQKILAVMAHVHECFDFKYFLKLDDDSYVRPAKLQTLILSQPSERLYFGQRRLHIRPHRDPNSKWFLPQEVYFQEELHPYVEGFAYVLSADMVAWIYRNRDMLRPLAGMDDISVALWMLALQVHPSHTNRFGNLPSLSTPSAKCSAECVILGHVESPRAMAEIHRKAMASNIPIAF